MNWIKIFGPEILQEGDFVRGITAGNKKLCMVKSGDKFYATQFYCPHAGAALAYGACKEGKQRTAISKSHPPLANRWTSVETPALRHFSDGRMVACHLASSETRIAA